jgi:hypothetical protein
MGLFSRPEPPEPNDPKRPPKGPASVSRPESRDKATPDVTVKVSLYELWGTR